MHQYPLIYAIAMDREALICDCFSGTYGDVGNWYVVVSRNLNDWEIDEYARLIGTISKLSLNDADDIPLYGTLRFLPG